MNETVRRVFGQCAETAMITNVRDAVSALSGETKLSKTVPWFGDRSMGGNFFLPFYKAPRSQAERELLEMKRRVLRQAGVGSKRFFDVPMTDNGNGLVNALLGWKKDQLRGLIDGRDLQFFMVTPEAEELARRVGSRIFGPSAEQARLHNDKIVQRESAGAKGAEIFPEYTVVGSEAEAAQAVYGFLKNFGSACIKVGHLASGEGMLRQPQSECQVRDFWRRWSRNLRRHNYPAKLLVERWHDKARPLSTQYFVDEHGKIDYLGASFQHIGEDGASHRGNVIGADLRSLFSRKTEEEMEYMSRYLLGLYPVKGARFVNFDFIEAGGRIMATEMNMRWTATTVLYSISAQMDNGHRHCYNLVKLQLDTPSRLSAKEILRLLSSENSAQEGILPLTIRYFDEANEAFLAAYAPTYQRTQELLQNLKSRL